MAQDSSTATGGSTSGRRRVWKPVLVVAGLLLAVFSLVAYRQVLGIVQKPS